MSKKRQLRPAALSSAVGRGVGFGTVMGRSL